MQSGEASGRKQYLWRNLSATKEPDRPLQMKSILGEGAHMPTGSRTGKLRKERRHWRSRRRVASSSQHVALFLPHLVTPGFGLEM